MDFETLSTIAATIPQEFGSVISQASAYIPDDLRDTIRHTASYLPHEISFTDMAQFLLYFAAASLVLGVISRVVLGKYSSLNHALSSVMAVLFIYTITVTLYTFKPWNLDLLLSPMPFATFSDHYLIIHPILDLQFPALCSELLSLLILAFLINLVDTLLPSGENVFSWLLLRLITGADSKATVKQIAAWAVAAIAKFATLYLLVAKLICGVMAENLIASGVMKPPMVQALPATFSWPQLFTALIGGAVALVIVPVVRKALHR